MSNTEVNESIMEQYIIDLQRELAEVRALAIRVVNDAAWPSDAIKDLDNWLKGEGK